MEGPARATVGRILGTGEELGALRGWTADDWQEGKRTIVVHERVLMEDSLSSSPSPFHTFLVGWKSGILTRAYLDVIPRHFEKSIAATKK